MWTTYAFTIFLSFIFFGAIQVFMIDDLIEFFDCSSSTVIDTIGIILMTSAIVVGIWAGSALNKTEKNDAKFSDQLQQERDKEGCQYYVNWGYKIGEIPVYCAKELGLSK